MDLEYGRPMYRWNYFHSLLTFADFEAGYIMAQTFHAQAANISSIK